MVISFKYGTLFIRSSANEGDFQAKFVPKVGKIYALVNALSRYTDDERTHIDTIDKLHNYHKSKEFTHGKISLMEKNIKTISEMVGVVGVIELEEVSRKYISEYEEVRNHGINDVIHRKHVLCLLHNSDFREPVAPIVNKTQLGEVFFPGIPFPEVEGKDVISASPSELIHKHLLLNFPYASDQDATILVGWND